jgi:hypothetical protein
LAVERGDRRGQRAVDVARDEHEVGPLAHDHVAEALDDAPGLRPRREAADAQVQAGAGQAELGHEQLGHLGVEVLAGVHEQRGGALLLQRVDHRRDLRVVGPGSHHAEQLHAARV